MGNEQQALQVTRRRFFDRGALGLGAVALAGLLGEDSSFAAGSDLEGGGLPGIPHFEPKAKRVIFLFQSGGPSQLDLFDHKPGLRKLQRSELPDSIRGNQRLTGMTAAQTSFPVASSIFEFQRHGQSGQTLSELLPHTAGIADEIAIVRSMSTQQINHDPAITFL